MPRNGRKMNLTIVTTRLGESVFTAVCKKDFLKIINLCQALLTPTDLVKLLGEK